MKGTNFVTVNYEDELNLLSSLTTFNKKLGDLYLDIPFVEVRYVS